MGSCKQNHNSERHVELDGTRPSLIGWAVPAETERSHDLLIGQLKMPI